MSFTKRSRDNHENKHGEDDDKSGVIDDGYYYDNSDNNNDKKVKTVNKKPEFSSGEEGTLPRPHIPHIPHTPQTNKTKLSDQDYWEYKRQISEYLFKLISSFQIWNELKSNKGLLIAISNSLASLSFEESTSDTNLKYRTICLCQSAKYTALNDGLLPKSIFSDLERTTNDSKSCTEFVLFLTSYFLNEYDTKVVQKIAEANIYYQKFHVSKERFPFFFSNWQLLHPIKIIAKSIQDKTTAEVYDLYENSRKKMIQDLFSPKIRPGKRINIHYKIKFTAGQPVSTTSSSYYDSEIIGFGYSVCMPYYVHSVSYAEKEIERYPECHFTLDCNFSHPMRRHLLSIAELRCCLLNPGPQDLIKLMGENFKKGLKAAKQLSDVFNQACDVDDENKKKGWFCLPFIHLNELFETTSKYLFSPLSYQFFCNERITFEIPFETDIMKKNSCGKWYLCCDHSRFCECKHDHLTNEEQKKCSMDVFHQENLNEIFISVQDFSQLLLLLPTSLASLVYDYFIETPVKIKVNFIF